MPDLAESVRSSKENEKTDIARKENAKFKKKSMKNHGCTNVNTPHSSAFRENVREDEPGKKR